MSTNRNETVARARAPEVSVNREALERAFLHKLFSIQGKFAALATPNDYYMALAYTVRDRMLRRWVSTAAAYTRQRVAHGLLPVGRISDRAAARQQSVNLGIYEDVRAGDRRPRARLRRLLAQEPEPGLGNGGLGRLAACFIDSLATLEIPALGYGIRYEFGIFQQEIVDGWQVEKTDKWLQLRQPVGAARAPSGPCEVQLGGHTERYHGRARPAARALGAEPDSSTACPTTRPSSATATTPPTRCGCGAPRRPSRSTSPYSTAATTTAPSTRR